MKDGFIVILCILNISIYSFIGLNYEAFQQVISYQADSTNTTSEQTLPLSSSITKILHSSPLLKPQASWSGTLSIPKLNITSPVNFPGNESSLSAEEWLKKGVLSISPHPLQNKTSQTIIFGHSSDYSWNQNPYGSIFALLPQLELGDEILLELNNQKLIYKVEEKIQTDPSLTEIINRPKKGQQIILSTCYPIGFFSERLNIIASLVSSSLY